MVKSDWVCPSEFPDLRGRGAKWFSVDIESKDPNLFSHGPGFLRGDAGIAGVAVATEGYSRYFPVGHEAGGNLSKKLVAQWLNTQLSGNEPKYGAYLQYDLCGLLVDMGVTVNGPIRDIQVAEPLIDENQLDYSLDALGNKYLGEGKDETLLLAACEHYGIGKVVKGTRTKYKGEMWRLPAQYVGPYAERDAALPPRIFERQEVILRQQDLMRVWDVESRITPILVKMWRRGVRVDVDRAPIVAQELRARHRDLLKEIQDSVGAPLDIWAPESLVKTWQRLGLEFPRTARDNPSFTAKYLETADHPVAKMIVRARKLEKVVRDFIEGLVLKMHVNGRIHPTWNQLRQDDRGARSGRFSCTDPNLQQISARDPEFGPLVRGLFVPDEGCEWGCVDVSQQEFRWTVHFGCAMRFAKADVARQAYIDDPKMDFHSFVATLTGLIRKYAKAVNLGLSYSMGVAELAHQLGIPVEEAQGMFDQYNERMPFIRELNRAASNLASSRGWVKTVLGRRAHFDQWEPADWPTKDSPGTHFVKNKLRWKSLPLEAAREIWPDMRLRRAWTYKAYNRIVQGTAGDQLKKAMVDLDAEGILVPVIVHDECDLSFDDPKPLLKVREALINALPCSVPMRCDIETGPNWGQLTTPAWA